MSFKLLLSLVLLASAASASASASARGFPIHTSGEVFHWGISSFHLEVWYPIDNEKGVYFIADPLVMDRSVIEDVPSRMTALFGKELDVRITNAIWEKLQSVNAFDIVQLDAEIVFIDGIGACVINGLGKILERRTLII